MDVGSLGCNLYLEKLNQQSFLFESYVLTETAPPFDN